MSELSPVKLLEGLRKRDHRVLSKIYKKYYPLVLGYILRNNGGDSDAKDIFQESFIVVYQLAEDETFKIEEDFGTLIVGIAKRIWLKKIRQDTVHQRYVDYNKENGGVEEHPSDVELEYELEMALIRKHIVNLGEDCRKVLMLSAEGVKNEKIAKQLGYKNEKVIRTKKGKCKEALIGMIKSDPDFKFRDR